MATCEWCKKEMTAPQTRSCVPRPVQFPDSRSLDPIPYGQELRFADTDHHPPRPSASARRAWRLECNQRNCSDCGVIVDGVHHPGCDMEECPQCHGQLISCGCLDELEEPSAAGSRLLH